MPMLTSSRVTGAVLSLRACLPGPRIGTSESTDGATLEKAPLHTFATPRAALQAGLESFRSGDTASAIEALKNAASGGERWRNGGSPKFMPVLPAPRKR